MSPYLRYLSLQFLSSSHDNAKNAMLKNKQCSSCAGVGPMTALGSWLLALGVETSLNCSAKAAQIHLDWQREAGADSLHANSSRKARSWRDLEYLVESTCIQVKACIDKIRRRRSAAVGNRGGRVVRNLDRVSRAGGIIDARATALHV